MHTIVKFATLTGVLLMVGAAANAAPNTAGASAAFKWNQGHFEKVIPLKDGSRLHEYRDGKMALENSYGHVVSRPVGDVVTAVDDSAITMTSNELGRLSQQLRIHR